MLVTLLELLLFQANRQVTPVTLLTSLRWTRDRRASCCAMNAPSGVSPMALSAILLASREMHARRTLADESDMPAPVVSSSPNASAKISPSPAPLRESGSKTRPAAPNTDASPADTTDTGRGMVAPASMGKAD